MSTVACSICVTRRATCTNSYTLKHILVHCINTLTKSQNSHKETIEFTKITKKNNWHPYPAPNATKNNPAPRNEIY